MKTITIYPATILGILFMGAGLGFSNWYSIAVGAALYIGGAIHKSKTL